MENEKPPVPQELKGLDTFSKLLDTTFRIPFTNIRFGIDFLMGLFPYVGDIITFLFSAGLVLTMARHGVSGQVVGKMIWNIVVDTIVGSIPVVGDMFDLYFRSNRRNFHLLQEHYGEGEYQGSIWRVVIPILIILILLFVLMTWLVWKVISWSWALIVG